MTTEWAWRQSLTFIFVPGTIRDQTTVSLRCLLPKRKGNIKKLLLFSETRLWFQLVKSEDKRDSFCYAWCLCDAFWSCQDNGGAYAARRRIKLPLYLHIDTFTASADNGAHMTKLYFTYECAHATMWKGVRLAAVERGAPALTSHLICGFRACVRRARELRIRLLNN